MLTRAGTALALLATGLLMGGLVLAVPLLLALGAVPLALLVIGLALPPPRVAGSTVAFPRRARAGDVVLVRAGATVAGGAGTTLLAVQLPPEFELVQGSNVRAVTAAGGHREVVLEFHVRLTRRGTFQVGPLVHESVGALSVRAGESGSSGDAIEVEVHPRVVPVRRLLRVRGTSSAPAPEEDVARLGLRTTDFREIRQYAYGDPPSAVNWKATARLGPGAAFPLVNEYEVEGRKSVFMFFDAGPGLRVGTSVFNGFEAGLGAVSGLALTLLDRGFKVGFYAYNAPPGGEPVYPDVGTQQFLKISRLLARLEPGAGTEGFVAALERCRAWVVRETAMAVIVARADSDPGGLEQGIRRLQRFASGRRRPIVLVAPQPYSLIPPTHERGADAARLLTAASRPAYGRLRRLGVVVVPWDPASQKLETLLLKGVLPA